MAAPSSATSGDSPAQSMCGPLGVIGSIALASLTEALTEDSLRSSASCG